MVDTHPRKHPTQARARATVDALVEAAARILAADGPDALTTNRIAEVAGVGIGSLYQYFPSKEAIVAALVERQLEADRRALEEALEAVDGLAVEEALPALLRILARQQNASSPVLRHLIPLVPALERQEILDATVARMTDGFRRFLAARDVAVDEDAVFAIVAALRGALNEATVRRPELLLDRGFTGRLVAMTLAGLRGAEAG
jgi:AcrR family transcriptional regulator